ncbi:MAG: HAD family hydrolase [Theionarchaea archaeon]|nr:HAD family hydrolase [Theionarchaea archaeon]
MVTVISFDVDGTLVDSSFADRVWLEGVPHLYAEQYGIPFEIAQQKIIKEYDRIGEEDIRWYQLKYWFNHFRLEGSRYDLLNTYKNEITVYEEVFEVLPRLHKKYTLIVASNAHRDFLSLTLSTIEIYFDHIFSATSDFKRVGKYEEFYREVCRQLNVHPGEVAHVGDHYTFDYEVPRQLGIHAFFLDRTRRKGRGLRNLREFEEEILTLEGIENSHP